MILKHNEIHSARELAALLHTGDQLVLLENTLTGQEHGWHFLFVDPVQIIQISHVREVLPLLETIQQYLREGYYLAGYFSYECGYAIEKLGMLEYTSRQGPLAWFGVYRTAHRLDASLLREAWQELETTLPEASISDLLFNLNEEQYRQHIERVREHIRAGDVYQINFTGRYRFRYTGEPLRLYAQLRQQQRTPYSAYIRHDGCNILCCSPELFFQRTGEQIMTKPMKGTAARGRTLLEDEQQVAWLSADQKNRAENIMITDLLRNDLGRICQVGSVAVPHLLEVETYQTVLQMTSTVTGTLTPGLDSPHMLPSLFPCGSVTGAPKIKAMELIHQLEETPRGIYTGSIGYFAPATPHEPSQALFNVAIRTLVLEQGEGVMGIGSGIVSDSDAATEFAECQIKARFLTAQAPSFALLETVLWKNGRYQYLERHLARMANSAHYFGYPWCVSSARALLLEQCKQMQPEDSYKVRLQLTREGQFKAESLPVQPVTEAEPLVVLSTTRTDARDCMYFHKTTHRPLYERATRFAQEHGYADVLFCNGQGEITEGAISNVFIERAGELLTPPVECGLLPGIARQVLLAEQPYVRAEKLTFDDLFKADAIYICNAIRGVRRVRIASAIRFE